MNPEFARNLWLEAAPRRIVGAGVVLALLYGAVILAARDSDDPQAAIKLVGQAGMAVFVACGVIWGAWAAGAAVLDEIRGRTWEFQRLSAIDPWSMTWGKLFGATSLAWIAAVTGLAAVALSAAVVRGPAEAPRIVFGLAALGVFVQACAMGAALIGVRKARTEGRMASGGAVVLGVLGGLLLLSMVSSSLGLHGMHWSIGALFSALAQPPVTWWGQEIPALTFTSLSLGAFAAWAVVGAWRLMRLELQIHNTPWLWTGFLVFAALWRAGLASEAGGPSAWAFAAGATLLVAAYVAAFAEPADPIRMRRFAEALRSRAWLKAADLAPAALFAMKLATIAMIVFCCSPKNHDDDALAPSAFTALGLLAFVIRDLGVIALFRFGSRPGRGDLMAVIVLALLYAVGGLVGSTAFGPAGGAAFMPLARLNDSGWIVLASGVVQAAIAWMLVAQRLGRLGSRRAST
ncbi:MAG TPA: hypothetical protein VHY32_05445 [Caulobacteraceae bacterium]|jgi:hypothetical protein|nr:hypothetical protein [Caulobacteraceae bacterium]